MQNGPKPNMDAHQSRPAASSAAHSKLWTSGPARPEPIGPQNAEETTSGFWLARTEAQIGNTVGAENCSIYAERYFRSMSSDPKGT